MNRFTRRQAYAQFFVLTLCCFAVAAPLLTGCSCTVDPPSRFDPAVGDTAPPVGAPAVAKEAVSGGSLNKFFPKAEGEFSSVFTQEKQGFAMAKLSKDGKEVASLAIMDTLSNPAAKTKFEKSDQKYGDYPLASSGSKGTAVLVADRFQVQIRSLDDSFIEFQREDWLGKFDLEGLAKHK